MAGRGEICKVCSTHNPQPRLDPPKSKFNDGQKIDKLGEKMYKRKYSLLDFEVAFVFRRAARLCESNSPLAA